MRLFLSFAVWSLIILFGTNAIADTRFHAKEGNFYVNLKDPMTYHSSIKSDVGVDLHIYKYLCVDDKISTWYQVIYTDWTECYNVLNSKSNTKVPMQENHDGVAHAFAEDAQESCGCRATLKSKTKFIDEDFVGIDYKYEFCNDTLTIEIRVIFVDYKQYVLSCTYPSGLYMKALPLKFFNSFKLDKGFFKWW
jgi:hypothetical protein